MPVNASTGSWMRSDTTVSMQRLAFEKEWINQSRKVPPPLAIHNQMARIPLYVESIATETLLKQRLISFCSSPTDVLLTSKV